LRDERHAFQAVFTAAALTLPGKTTTQRLSAWQARHATGLAGLTQTLTEMQTAGTADFATLSVALQSVRRVV
jgi:NAD-specific glutamate dehydrogenase